MSGVEQRVLQTMIICGLWREKIRNGKFCAQFLEYYLEPIKTYYY